MSETQELELKKVFDKDRYWNGVFTGVFIGCFLISILLLFYVRVRGLTVAIDPERIAGLAQLKIQAEAKRSIPQVLQGIKQELPGKISSNLTELDNLQISIGKTQVKLPNEAVNAIRSEFNRIMEEAIINTLNDYNTTQYEAKIGQNAYEMVRNTLRQEVIGKTYIVKTSQWFTLPVKIVGTSKNSIPTKI